MLVSIQSQTQYMLSEINSLLTLYGAWLNGNNRWEYIWMFSICDFLNLQLKNNNKKLIY